MPAPSHDFADRVLSGRDRSLPARSLRAITTIAEPFYTAAIRTRNVLYDRSILKTRRLPRAAISVGNITTGGTGKTPVVMWLANRLRQSGLRPAVLLRGYGARDGFSDEQQVLFQNLNRTDQPPIPVQANPNRVAGAATVLAQNEDINAFVLDDGFQHRKVHRDFDLVLINATDPFGHGRVLPRGLLREPLEGLQRATAFLITRCSQATDDQLDAIRSELRRHNPAAAIYHADHIHTAMLNPITGGAESLDSLTPHHFYAFAGIGNPAALDAQLQLLPGQYAGHRWYPDHHAYTQSDLEEIHQVAKGDGATCIVTTEKDWVKIARLGNGGHRDISMYVLGLGIRFHEGEEDVLFREVVSVIGKKV